MEKVYYYSSISGLKIVDVRALETGNNELIGCTSKIASILNFVGKNNDFVFLSILTSGVTHGTSVKGWRKANHPFKK